MASAMYGFANIVSLGILICWLINIGPERSREITSLGPCSILSGVLATLVTGAVVDTLNRPIFPAIYDIFYVMKQPSLNLWSSYHENRKWERVCGYSSGLFSV